MATTCNGQFVLFGGYDQTGSNRYDTWTWDGTTRTEFPSTGAGDLPPTVGPKTPLGAVMASVKDKCYFIDVDGEMYTWSGASWDTVNQGSVVPPPRYSGVAAAQGDKLVFFGGVLPGNLANIPPTLLGDTWIWDGSAWTQSTAPGPAPRDSAMMASYGDTVALFGGQGVPDANDVPSFLGDTWTWNGSQWTQMSGVGPSPRSMAAMVGH